LLKSLGGKSTEVETGVEKAAKGGCSHTCSVHHGGLLKSLGKNPEVETGVEKAAGGLCSHTCTFYHDGLLKSLGKKPTAVATPFEKAAKGGCSHTCSVHHDGLLKSLGQKSTAVDSGVKKGAKGRSHTCSVSGQRQIADIAWLSSQRSTMRSIVGSHTVPSPHHFADIPRFPWGKMFAALEKPYHINKTLSHSPIGFTTSSSLFNSSRLRFETYVSMHVGIVLGVVAEGTLIPPKISDFGVAVGTRAPRRRKRSTD